MINAVDPTGKSMTVDAAMQAIQFLNELCGILSGNDVDYWAEPDHCRTATGEVCATLSELIGRWIDLRQNPLGLFSDRENPLHPGKGTQLGHVEQYKRVQCGLKSAVDDFFIVWGPLLCVSFIDLVISG